MDQYLKEIGAIPRLAEPECRRLIALAQVGDVTSRNKVVEGNLRLVVEMAKRYNRLVPTEELVAEGNLGLFIAVRKFNLNAKNKDGGPIKFSTYAGWWIKSYMRMLVKSPPYTGVVGIPGYLVELILKQSGDPKLVNLKKSTQRCLEAAKVSMKTREAMEQGDWYELNLPDRNQLNPSDVCADRELVIIIHSSKSLTDREKDILTMTIEDGKTLDVAGVKHKVTKERIRQIRNLAVAKLQKELVP